MVERDGPPASEDTARLLAFLRQRDVACPVCKYNLRDLTTTTCPECRQPLEMTVGVRFDALRLGWFIATIAPCIFSGIAAALLMIPIIAAPILGGGSPPWFIVAADLFGWLSGMTAIGLVLRRIAFIAQPIARQRVWAMVVWGVHLGVFVLFLITIFS